MEANCVLIIFKDFIKIQCDTVAAPQVSWPLFPVRLPYQAHAPPRPAHAARPPMDDKRNEYCI